MAAVCGPLSLDYAWCFGEECARLYIEVWPDRTDQQDCEQCQRYFDYTARISVGQILREVKLFHAEEALVDMIRITEQGEVVTFTDTLSPSPTDGETDL